MIFLKGLLEKDLRPDTKVHQKKTNIPQSG